MMQTLPFSELGISDGILQTIDDIGYEEATAIQTQTIPLLLSGRDVIGQSQTGTGKTAAFAIPAIEMISRQHGKGVQALVLCPTRELAIQACEEIRRLTTHTERIRAAAIYGGQDIERQIRLLRGGAQIVVGTPGRLMDHMRRHTLLLDNVKIVVLDEADEMLSMGFREDIETILRDIPEERQTALFSATMSPEIMEITHQYLRDPEVVKVIRKELTV
ncbi:MAG: DEAD/DEAH box helicase, partial [Clostridia bacterium]|nr:DEAD/DEAH box helicase [Clostridia bacterium]